MDRIEGRTPGPDDTAAFQQFYANRDVPKPQRGVLYRALIGWWRDRR
jgi:hypothetical protein